MASKGAPPELHHQGKTFKNLQLEIRINMLCPEYTALHQNTLDREQKQL